MNSSTVAALKQLSFEFYEYHSTDFSTTRSQPWVGWQRALQSCLKTWAKAPEPYPKSILDVGCGNGRFGIFLEQKLSGPFDYVGVDSSAGLLATAAARLPGGDRGARSFFELDLASSELDQFDGAAHFHLVAVLGLLHHIPSCQLRLALLRRLVNAVEPDGVMILSFWQFGTKSRFLKRIIPWEVHNQTAIEKIDVDELEAGDCLLPWGDPESVPPEIGSHAPRRYCHYSSPEDSARLVEGLPVEVVSTFYADGRSDDLNLYYILRKSA